MHHHEFIYNHVINPKIIECLFLAAKWSAELLEGLDESTLNLSNQFEHQHTFYNNYDASLPSLNEQEFNKYQYARSLFHLRQFENVNFILKGYNNPRLRFLRLYARYLLGEKQKEEQHYDVLSVNDNSLAENLELGSIHDELAEAYEGDQPLDAFCLYLFGVVLRQRGENQTAAHMLIESIKQYQYNWSAWKELGTLVVNKKMFNDIQKLLDTKLSNSIMKDFFLANLTIELHFAKGVFEEYMIPLIGLFPESTYIIGQLAMAYYGNAEYETSQNFFEQIRKQNPYRLDQMDVYSNLLYIKRNQNLLSILAHQSEKIDKCSPETCCIIGNYYSCKREGALAIEYFKRALKLNRSYIWAWTLLGHDYIELKNANAAIECYKRAININPRSYIAWYGLGQAYEVLKLPYYATYYYQKATELKPHDGRMWNALAQCYRLTNMQNEAQYCYERANESPNPGSYDIPIQLARIYDKMLKPNKAAELYEKAITDLENQGKNDSEEIAEGKLYLAKYMIADQRYDVAERYAREVLPFNFPYHEEAKSLLEEIKNLANNIS
ncbi:unnamed protein product [Cunninghamella blakesleeana]